MYAEKLSLNAENLWFDHGIATINVQETERKYHLSQREADMARQERTIATGVYCLAKRRVQDSPENRQLRSMFIQSVTAHEAASDKTRTAEDAAVAARFEHQQAQKAYDGNINAAHHHFRENEALYIAEAILEAACNGIHINTLP